MKNIKSLVLIGLAHSILSAGAITVSSGSIVQGEWNSNFIQAKSLADSEHIPMLVFWGSTECGYCNALKSAVMDADFLAWQSARQLIMVQCNNWSSPDSSKCFDFAIDPQDANNYYPRMVVYWVKNDGQKVVERFAGRDNTMLFRSGTLAQRLMATVDYYIAGWAGVPDSGYVPSSSSTSGVSAGSVITKAVTYMASVRGEDGLEGLLTLKIGKGNRRGESSVGGKFTDLLGKGYSIKSVKLSSASWPVTGTMELRGLGSLAVSITESGVTGSLNGMEVSSVGSVGELSDGKHRATLMGTPTIPNLIVFNELLPDVDFTVQGRKLVFPKAPSYSYKDMTLVINSSDGSRNNMSGLKLTLAAKTGLLKGSFKVFGVMNGRLKSYAAKVTGFVVDGVGSAKAQINKVYYPMVIK